MICIGLVGMGRRHSARPHPRRAPDALNSSRRSLKTSALATRQSTSRPGVSEESARRCPCAALFCLASSQGSQVTAASTSLHQERVAGIFARAGPRFSISASLRPASLSSTFKIELRDAAAGRIRPVLPLRSAMDWMSLLATMPSPPRDSSSSHARRHRALPGRKTRQHVVDGAAADASICPASSPAIQRPHGSPCRSARPRRPSLAKRPFSFATNSGPKPTQIDIADPQRLGLGRLACAPAVTHEGGADAGDDACVTHHAPCTPLRYSLATGRCRDHVGRRDVAS